MDAVELNRRAVKAGVPRAIVEKDYALSVGLFQLSGSKLANQLVFKGGTAVKKVYFPDARFSEDLDFSVLGVNERSITSALSSLFEGQQINGINFIGLEKVKTRAGLQVALKFSSVLGHVQRIRFDFSFRDNLALTPKRVAVLDDYGLGEAKLLVLSLEELLAEKIHALFGRKAARDLYDVWFLSKRGVKLNPSLIEKKFAYYGEHYAPEKLGEVLESFRRVWRQDLSQFLKTVPVFDAVAKDVVRFLSR